MLYRTLCSSLVLLTLAACGSGGGGGGGEQVLKVEKWTPSGDNQTDTVGQTLPNVIRVKVTLDGALASGVTVNFSGGNLGTPSMVTGSNGIATSTWTLAAGAGPQQVTVTVDGAVGSPLIFHATALSGAPYGLTYAGPSTGFVADTNQIFAGFSVKVVDTFTNPISDRWVQWSASGPIRLATDSIITGSDGVSTMFGTAGIVAGDITVTAAVTGLVGSPRQFTGAVVEEVTTVTVADFSFSPDSLVIPAGSAVRWVWTTGTHSVTPTGDPVFAESDLQAAPSAFGPILFNTPGVYQYECSVHPAQMKGRVVVQ